MKIHGIERDKDYSDGNGTWRMVLEVGNKLIVFRTIIQDWKVVRHPKVEVASPVEFAKWAEVGK